MKCVKTTTRVNDEDKDGSENIKSFSKDYHLCKLGKNYAQKHSKR